MPPLVTTLIDRLSDLGLEFTKFLVWCLVCTSHFSMNQEVLNVLYYGMEMVTPWPLRKLVILRDVTHLITIIALYFPRTYTNSTS